ncbi:enoyl-CoA hydratase/isomerase family protein [Vibrio alfacsensis]|uniref:enoyl-CoA hydratase/isomerase family protein n=1 Tax=Vibrio alfacsensis TaxID=1074311 RepID=UPI004069529E
MSIYEHAWSDRDFSLLNLSVTEQTCQITLTRSASLNAFNQQMRAELADALTLINDDEQIRTVVLLAEGHCFSAGADLSELSNECDNVQVQLLEEYAPIFNMIRQSDKIFIAGVHGVAAGIGAALAMSCDLLVMADNAQLYPAFMLLGLVPDGGTSWHFVKQLGYRKSLELCLEAKSIDATTCLDLGLINKVVAHNELKPFVADWAEKLSKGPSIAQRHVKPLLQQVDKLSFEQAFAMEAELQQQCFISQDFEEGLRAFFEKRQPRFSGK